MYTNKITSISNYRKGPLLTMAVCPGCLTPRTGSSFTSEVCSFCDHGETEAGSDRVPKKIHSFPKKARPTCHFPYNGPEAA